MKMVPAPYIPESGFVSPRRMQTGEDVTGIVESTLGRFLFNEILPQDLGYVDRTKPENVPAS